MVMNDELRELVVQRQSASRMLPVARASGMKLLAEDGWSLVREGVTTPEEILRLTTA